MIGNSITDGRQSASGTYGYIVSFDLSASEVQSIEQVQMQDINGVLSTPITTPTSRELLFSYMEDDQEEIDFGYFLDSSTLFVFCRTAVYPFESTVYIAWWFKRFGIDMATSSATIDTAQNKEQLLRC